MYKMDNRGSVYIWFIALMTIVIGGIMMIGMVEVESVITPLGSDLGVPEAQRMFMHDVITRGFPIGILVVTLIWAWTKSQKGSGGQVY